MDEILGAGSRITHSLKEVIEAVVTNNVGYDFKPWLSLGSAKQKLRGHLSSLEAKQVIPFYDRAHPSVTIVPQGFALAEDMMGYCILDGVATGLLANIHADREYELDRVR